MLRTGVLIAHQEQPIYAFRW